MKDDGEETTVLEGRGQRKTGILYQFSLCSLSKKRAVKTTASEVQSRVFVNQWPFHTRRRVRVLR